MMKFKKAVWLEINEVDNRFSYLPSIESALGQAQTEMLSLDETIISVKTLKPDCDAVDYALAASSVFQSVRRNASTSPASRPSSTSTSACTAADARRRVREERFAKEGSSPLILATDFMGIVIR